ncbi:MAG TPA: ATP-binding cassette domain-containing protein [Thermoanaerobaculia bacterium]|nr:ATP-binding cassette domain-containing protein [Thermoanaerobaculia bacterium]
MSVLLRDVVLPLAHFTLEVSVEMAARTTALYGPSGSGKTSILEVIAGLRRPMRGHVEIHRRSVDDVPPRARRVGYVPQDDALFPHLSVRQNVCYGGAAEGTPVLDVLEIGHLMERGVRQLSGGERKRVALARALLSKPEVLLLDEPLAGVDVELRGRVLEYLVRVRDEFPVPMIYVTHDIAEAGAVCEEIVVMERGRVVEKRRL